MFMPVSKFLESLRAPLPPEGNSFTRSGAPEVGAKWEAVCLAVADFVEAARDNEIVGYDTAVSNLHAMGHAAPPIDVERDFGLVPAGAEAPQPAPATAPVGLAELTQAEIDAFVAALEKLPSADDPNDATPGA